MTQSAMLILSGTVCILLSGLMTYMTLPREGRPPSAWTKTEGRAVTAAMLVLLLFFAGGIMIAKGIF